MNLKEENAFLFFSPTLGTEKFRAAMQDDVVQLEEATFVQLPTQRLVTRDGEIMDEHLKTEHRLCRRTHGSCTASILTG